MTLSVALGVMLVLGLLLMVPRAVAIDLDPAVDLDIGAGTPLDQALLELANKANMLLLAGSLSGYTVPQVKGTYPVSQALARLMAPSGLSYKIQGRTIYILASAQTGGSQAGNIGPNGPLGRELRQSAARDKSARRRNASERAGEGDRGMHEVTVEGHIPGSPLSFPNITLTREDFERGGFQTVGDALRTLPQSFGGGLNVGVISAGGSLNTTSQAAPSTANLRGLGSDSTLVLVNGQRLATSEGSGAVDVTLIPISSVERIEITTGSASALYGSDAVAGVVNIILRTDFQGLELSAALGGATEGGDFLQHYSVVAGHAGDRANLFATGDCAWQQEVDSQQRTYIPTAIAGTTLLPRTQHCSALFSATRSLPHDLEASVLGVYTTRSAYSVENFSSPANSVFGSWQTHVGQYALDATLTRHFFETWTAAVSASWSADDVTSPETLIRGGALYQQEGERFDNRLWSGQVIASGTLLETGAGPVQLALGGGYHQEGFLFADLPRGMYSVAKSRRIRFAFAESTVPLVRSSSGAKDPTLSLDMAVRSEAYSDVGNTTNPKVALVYRPTSSVRVSASVGTSFRAPSLLQLFNGSQVGLETIIDPTSATGQSLALLRFGGNPYLRPEESTDTALDLTLTPEAVPGASLQIGWYEIFYRKRIENPTLNTANPLSDPNSGPFVTRNPSPEEIAQVLAQSQLSDLTGGRYTAQEAALIIDDRSQNIVRQKASGVDVLSKYTRDTAFGRWDTSVNIAYLDLQQQVTRASPMMPLTGTIFYPPNWRARLGLSWNYSRYLASLFANYTGRSREDNTPGGPLFSTPKPVASWTTLDAQIGRVFNGGTHPGNTRLTLSAQNLLDRHPPLLDPGQSGSIAIDYDSTNVSAVGRFVTAQVTRVW